jgi:hypothetical protein
LRFVVKSTVRERVVASCVAPLEILSTGGRHSPENLVENPANLYGWRPI